MSLELLGTSGCHLCDDAEIIVSEVLANRGANQRLHRLEIADDEALLEAYGTRIPVLRQGAAVLGWPFDYDAVAAFLSLD